MTHADAASTGAQPLAIFCVRDEHWADLCDVMEQPALEDAGVLGPPRAATAQPA